MEPNQKFDLRITFKANWQLITILVKPLDPIL